MKIKYLFFDIDDTLFPTTEFAEMARKNALISMVKVGLDKRVRQIFPLLKKIIKEKGSNYTKHFDELCNQLEIKSHKSKYIAAAVLAYHSTKHSIQPYPSVPRILLRLREKYGLYIASNGSSIKQWDKLIRLGLVLFFDDVFISQDMSVEKSPKFFRKVLRKIKAKPEECVMIGDRIDSDVNYPKECGIHTIRLKLGKHAKLKSNAEFEIKHFYELERVLKKLESQKNKK